MAADGLMAADKLGSLSERKFKPLLGWGISIFEQTPLPPIHDLPNRTHSKISEFYTTKITESLGRRPDSKQSMEGKYKSINAFLRLYGIHKNKIINQYKREANSEEIIAILKNIDKELRTKIDKGDFELDITEDLKKEGYVMVDGTLTKLK